MESPLIEIFTDGSCHSKLRIGGWAAYIVKNDENVTLTGIDTNTTHNRMELMAVIKAIKHVAKNKQEGRILLYSDSQYVCNLPSRFERLKQKNFLTNRGTDIQNTDLVQTLMDLLEKHNVELIKVKAHQKNNSFTTQSNRYVDKLSRKIVREQVNRR